MPRSTLEHCAKQREIAWRIFRKIQIPAMEEIFFITWSLGRVYMLLGILPSSPLHRYCRTASETANMEIKDGLAVAADDFLVIGGLLGGLLVSFQKSSDLRVYRAGCILDERWAHVEYTWGVRGSQYSLIQPINRSGRCASRSNIVVIKVYWPSIRWTSSSVVQYVAQLAFYQPPPSFNSLWDTLSSFSNKLCSNGNISH